MYTNVQQPITPSDTSHYELPTFRQKPGRRRKGVRPSDLSRASHLCHPEARGSRRRTCALLIPRSFGSHSLVIPSAARNLLFCRMQLEPCGDSRLRLSGGPGVSGRSGAWIRRWRIRSPCHPEARGLRRRTYALLIPLPFGRSQPCHSERSEEPVFCRMLVEPCGDNRPWLSGGPGVSGRGGA